MPTATPRTRTTDETRPDAAAASPVRAIERTMKILRALGSSAGYVTLTELSQSIDLHKSTVLRFLRTLEQGGFVASGPGGKGWRPGPVFLDIKSRAIAEQDLAEIARPLMEQAVKLTNETVQMAILAETSIVYIAKIEPLDAPLRINTQIGTRRPVHCTALGKVLTAWRDPAEVDAIIAAAGLTRFTDATITSAPALHRALAKVRRDGHGFDLGEFNQLVSCVAAPIRGADGRVVAGLNISSFGQSGRSARFAELTRQATATAERISERIGWKPGATP